MARTQAWLAHAGSRFGGVRKDVAKKSFDVGETVSVEFQSACPRNNLRTGGTFLIVERLSEDNGDWEVVSTVFFLFILTLKSPRAVGDLSFLQYEELASLSSIPERTVYQLTCFFTREAIRR